VITYCRIGERSSHAWFVLQYLLGVPKRVQSRRLLDGLAAWICKRELQNNCRFGRTANLQAAAYTSQGNDNVEEILEANEVYVRSFGSGMSVGAAVSLFAAWRTT
jgi:hypothetical protein